MEMAARIKDLTGAQILALTHDDALAETALRDCLAVGADQVYRICSKGDTARLLAQTIPELEQQTGSFSAVFCGIQSIDGGARYVGPALAELLRRPLIPNAIDAWSEADGIHVIQEGERHNSELRTSAPCIISVTKPLFAPGYPTIRSRMAANRAEISLLHPAASPTEKTGRKISSPIPLYQSKKRVLFYPELPSRPATNCCRNGHSKAYYKIRPSQKTLSLQEIFLLSLAKEHKTN